MTLAQKAAAHYRSEAVLAGAFEEDDKRAELNAIADVVEAAEAMRGHTPDYTSKAKDYDTALAKLAKAVGVEGENNG